MGLSMEQDAIDLLADRVQGNLLAASQEITKLGNWLQMKMVM